MKKFILLLREDVEVMQKLSPKEMEALVNAHMAWAEKLTAQGIMIAGDGLSSEGTQVVGPERIIKDGPYIEAKEMIGGYYLIQAESMAAALVFAKECPCNNIAGCITEVRPVMDYEAVE